MPCGIYVSRTDMPPWMIIGLPVMKVDRSERRKRAACAISFAFAIRFIGCRFAMKSKADFPSPPLRDRAARQQCIDANAICGVVGCQRLHQADQPGFGRGMGPIPGIPPLLKPTKEDVKTIDITDFAHIARIENIKQDIELLRRKAAGCERVARQATDVNFRRLNAKRAKLYRDLIEEAEPSLRGGQTLRLRRASWFGDRRKKPPGL